MFSIIKGVSVFKLRNLLIRCALREFFIRGLLFLSWNDNCIWIRIIFML